MVVKTYYSTGKADVFDTQTMTDSSVFPGNVLTNYALDMRDAEGGRALWLDIYYYEIPSSPDAPSGPKGIPAAVRRDGCSCILADAQDLATLQRVTVDGSDALVRVGEDFADCLKLETQSDLAYTVVPKATSTYAWLRAAETGEQETDEVSLWERIGFTEMAFEKVLEMERKASAPEEEEE